MMTWIIALTFAILPVQAGSVARAGNNDCFFASNSCAGTSTQNDDPRVDLRPARHVHEDLARNVGATQDHLGLMGHMQPAQQVAESRASSVGRNA